MMRRLFEQTRAARSESTPQESERQSRLSRVRWRKGKMMTGLNVVKGVAREIARLACSAVLVWGALLWLARPSIAQQLASEPDAGHVLTNASWLAGRWVGEGLGGEVEETWSPAASGQMVGHFRLTRNGAVVFYEISLLDVTAGGLRMRVKHFNADFVGWEDKDTWHSFEPIRATNDTLVFNGLRLRRLSTTEMETSVVIEYHDGEREETLRLHRAPL
jgi:hypothetical protein